MITIEAVEDFLETYMMRLCAAEQETTVPRDVAAVERLVSDLSLFADIVSVLGSPLASAPYTAARVAPFHVGSVEHRFALRRWPHYDLVVKEAPDGRAWGYGLSRSSNSKPPELTSVDDLHRWSHTMSEVVDTLGPPLDEEGWSDWQSVVFALPDGITVHLCFALGLLQSVKRIGSQ